MGVNGLVAFIKLGAGGSIVDHWNFTAPDFGVNHDQAARFGSSVAEAVDSDVRSADMAACKQSVSVSGKEKGALYALGLLLQPPLWIFGK